MSEKEADIEVRESETSNYLMLLNIVCPMCGDEKLMMHRGSRKLSCEGCGQKYEGLADLRRWHIIKKEFGKSPEVLEEFRRITERERKVVYEQCEK